MAHLIIHSIRRSVSTHRRKFLSALILSIALFTFSAADQPAGTKIWDFYTGASIQSSAAIGQHGIVYFGTDSGKLYSFYPDGRGIWEYPTGDRIVGSPAIADDGTVIFGSTDGILYAVEPAGKENWRFQANGPIASSPAIGPDGTVVFGTMSKRLFALRADGSKLWDLESSAPIVGSPSISKHGVVYVAGADGTLAAISVKGDILWQFDAPNSIVSSPAIGADGTVYFGCFDGHVYAVSAVGKKLWTYATGGPVKSSPAVGPDGVIYIGSDDKLLYALAPDGFKKWTFSVGAAIRSTPAVAADGTIYIGSYDDALYAISPDGTKRWEFVTDEDVTSSPAIAADGTVFFGSWNGRFYAVKGTAGLAAGAWPRFRGNADQTGYRGSMRFSPTPTAPTSAAEIAANNPVQPVNENSVVKRSGRSWWDRVFGGESRTAKNRGVIGGGETRQMAQSEANAGQTKVISDAREMMNAEMTTIGQPATTTVTQISSTPVISTPTVSSPATVVPPVATALASAPTTSSGALPMMNLVSASGSSPVTSVRTTPVTTVNVPPVTSIPATEPVKANVPAPIPPQTPAPVAVAPTRGSMQMVPATTSITTTPVVQAVDVPPVSALETPVVTQPKAPVVPAAPTTPVATIDGRLPMMRLIESGAARKTSSVISETGMSSVTFGTTMTGVGVQTLTTDVSQSGADAVESTVTEISAKETTAINSTAPASDPVKPLSVSTQIREPRYVPGVIQSLITGEKRRGKDPIPPAPKLQNVEIRERNYQRGFFQRLIRPGKRPVTKRTSSAVETKAVEIEPSKADIKVGGNSAVVEVETVEIEDATKSAKKTTAVPAPESKGMRVISDSSKLFAADGGAVKKAASDPIVEVATVEIIDAPKTKEPEVKVVSVQPTTTTTPTVQEKITSMEKSVEKMAADLKNSRRERDALKAAAPSSKEPVVERTVASLQPEPVVDPEERIPPDSDPKTEKALNEVYGDKLSRLESHLISLNTELADARVERARLRKELAVARSGQPAAAPVVRSESGHLLAPAHKVAAPRVEKVEVVASPASSDIPQPDWLKKEIRSVLAAAGEQWEQPPGAPAAATATPRTPIVTPPVVTPPVVTPSASVVPESTAIVAVETIDSSEPLSANLSALEAAQPKQPEKARKPGFLTRLFGGRAEPTATHSTATNIVMVPPRVGDFPGAKPTDAQLLGTDPTFGLNLVPTNFPRIPYTPDKTGSFIQPGAGNVTQLAGFPRPEPRLVSPPVRDMEPNLRPGPRLRDLNIEETVTLVGDGKPKQLPVPNFKPQVVIVSPPDNSRLTNPVLDLRGMVKSRRRVAEVLVSVGGSEFAPAAGLDNWTYQTPVDRGLVLVRVKAVNVDGVPSEIETRTYHYHSRSRMTVRVVGQGGVSPSLNNQKLNIGQPYTVTAKPAPGQEFVGWSGAVTGSKPTVSFVMNKDLWLQAEFREKAPAIVAGRFTGLVHARKEIRAARSGHIDLQVDAQGNYLGSLQLAGKTHPLGGQFDAQWQAAESVSREGAAPLALALRLDRGNAGESLTGYFELSGDPVILRAFRTLNAGGTLTVIRPGNYRMLMPAPAAGGAGPAGVGFGEATIAADGRVEFSFQLPDGTRAKQSTHLSRKGVWPLYVPLYGGRGALAGWISSTQDAEFSLYGEVRWLKPGEGDLPGFAVPRMIYGSSVSASSASNSQRSSSALVAAR